MERRWLSRMSRRAPRGTSSRNIRYEASTEIRTKNFSQDRRMMASAISTRGISSRCSLPRIRAISVPCFCSFLRIVPRPICDDCHVQQECELTPATVIRRIAARQQVLAQHFKPRKLVLTATATILNRNSSVGPPRTQTERAQTHIKNCNHLV